MSEFVKSVFAVQMFYCDNIKRKNKYLRSSPEARLSWWGSIFL